MTARVHQLFSTEADLSAAWDRYVVLVKAAAANPSLLTDRKHTDAMLEAFNEYRRLFDLSERDRKGARA